jgi:hypothetical protein
MLFTALMALAFFLLYTVLSQLLQAPPGPGPSVATDVGLLTTIILCVYIGFRMTFVGKEAKNWKKALPVVGLICGSVVFFFLGLLVFFDYAGLTGAGERDPSTLNNISMAGDFLFIIAVILGLAAILKVILILDSVEVAEATSSRKWVT